MSEPKFVSPTAKMFALRKKGSNVPHLAPRSWGCFVEPLQETAKISNELEVVEVTIKPIGGEPYPSNDVQDLRQEVEYWKAAARTLADWNAATAEGYLHRKTSANVKRRFQEIAAGCASLLLGKWPEGSRRTPGSEQDRIVQRCTDAANQLAPTSDLPDTGTELTSGTTDNNTLKSHE